MIGATIGSTIKCLVDRRKNIETWILERSKCPSCRKVLKWYELIAFFSFIILRGKCSKCKSKIPVSCFVYECAFGLFFLCISISML